MINYKLINTLSETEFKLAYIVESHKAPLKTTLGALAKTLRSHDMHIMKTLKKLHLKNVLDYSVKRGRSGYIVLTTKESLNEKTN